MYKLAPEEIGFTLKNGMKISIHRPGLRGEDVEGEHLDLIIEHPNGSRGRIMVTLSGRTNGDKYVDFEVMTGQPLKMSGHVYSEYGPSFQPRNLDYIAMSSKGDFECSLKGIPDSFHLNLEPNPEE